jgi:hypothetical protein
MMSDMEKTLSQTITKIHEDSMIHISDDDDNDDHDNMSSYPPGATPGAGAGRGSRKIDGTTTRVLTRERLKMMMRSASTRMSDNKTASADTAAMRPSAASTQPTSTPPSDSEDTTTQVQQTTGGVRMVKITSVAGINVNSVCHDKTANKLARFVVICTRGYVTVSIVSCRCATHFLFVFAGSATSLNDVFSFQS